MIDRLRVAVIDRMIQTLNVGWTFVLISGLIVVFSPILVILWYKGMGWRLARMDKQAARSAAKAEKVHAKAVS